MFVLANVVRSGFGRQMRAVRDDEVSAQLAGIHVARTQVAAFVLSAACAGLGGGIYAAIADSANPGAFSLTQSLYLLLAIVLGGLGSLFGAVWGAIAIVLLPYAAAQMMSNEPLKLQGNVPMAIFGALLIVIAIALPGGVQGLLRRVGHLLWHRRPGASTASPPTPEVNASTPSTTS
jgi:branched-chain amino acid transport system permease protein